MVEIKSRYENDGRWRYFQLCSWRHCIYRRNLVAATLDPNCDESFTTESTCFFWNTRRRILQRIQNNFKKNSVLFECKRNEVSFIEQGYTFSIVHTSEFHSDIPKQLNLPLSI